MGQPFALIKACRHRLSRCSHSKTSTLAAAIVAAVALLGTAGAVPANAVPAGSPGMTIAGVPASSTRQSQEATSSEPCFKASYPDCSSTDPDVTFGSSSSGDTSGCEFQVDVSWGDDKTTDYTFGGGADGTQLATFTHTYEDPATYTIEATGETTVGSCFSSSWTLEFTLLGPADTFTVGGSAKSTQGQAGKEAHGSPAQARACETWEGQETYKKAEAVGHAIARTWQKARLATASALLDHFLQGTGKKVVYSRTSQVTAEIKKSSAFKAENKDILAYMKPRLEAGATKIDLPASSDNVHALAFLRYIVQPDLYWALRYTHGINVHGSGGLVGGNYVGSLTYVITESYGFNEGNTFAGIGTQMRYLQTTCGTPYYPGGAHWFQVSITVTVPFSIAR